MRTTYIIGCALLTTMVVVATPTHSADLDAAAQAEIEAALFAPQNGVAAIVVSPRVLPNNPDDLLYFSDFETDDGGLTGTRDWQWGEYAWPATTNCFGAESHPPAAFSGTKMWGTVLNDCYGDLGNNDDYGSCTNDDPADDSVLSIALDLTGETTAWVSWAEWNDVFLPFDWIEVRANGVVIGQACGIDFVAPEQWVENALDISAVSGQVVTISLHMMASALINRSGLYIDDVAVTRFDPRALFVDGFESGDTTMWSSVQP